jgi:hypothetical protein
MSGHSEILWDFLEKKLKLHWNASFSEHLVKEDADIILVNLISLA